MTVFKKFHYILTLQISSSSVCAEPAVTVSVHSTTQAITPMNTACIPACSASSSPTEAALASASTSAAMPTTLAQADLHSCLPLAWYHQGERTDRIQLCKLQIVHPMKISYCIVVELDGSWKVFVNNQHVERNVTPIFSAIPEHLNHAAVMHLISVMDSANVCCGYPQSKYIEMADARKGIFKSKDGVARAKVDTSLPVTLDGEVYHSTIRTTNCHILSLSPMCSKCKDYVSILRTCYSRWCKKSGDEVSEFTNNRYLTSPQKTKKIEQLQRKVVAGRQERTALLEKIERLTSQSGIEVEPTFHQDLLSIMEGYNGKVQAEFAEGSFRRLFWEQQFIAAKKGPKQIRWHPTLIR